MWDLREQEESLSQASFVSCDLVLSLIEVAHQVGELWGKER